MGFQTAVDDFDGQGRDLLAFSYIAQDAALAVLGFARGDPAFTVDRFGLAAGDFTGKAYCPDGSGCTAEAAGSPPQLAAGLFWYDEPSGHGLGRRQLALVALQTGGSGRGGDVGPAGLRRRLRLLDLRPAGPVPADPDRPARADRGRRRPVGDALDAGQRVPRGARASRPSPTLSLAAGSFQGLVLNPSDPSQVPWALAVGISGPGGQPGHASAVDLVRLSGTAPGAFTARPSGCSRCPSHGSGRHGGPGCWPTTRRGPPSCWGPRWSTP